MDLGPHQIFHGGKDQALGRARRGVYGTLAYGFGLGKRRNGRVGHGDDPIVPEGRDWAGMG